MVGIAVVLAFAFAFVLLLAAQRNLVFRRLAARLLRAVAAPLVALVRAAAWVAGVCLSPRGPRRVIARWRYGLWLLVGLAPLVVGLVAAGAPLLALPSWADPGLLIVLGAVFSALVLAAYCFVSFEDLDVMDGTVAADARRFRVARVAGRLPVAVVTSVMFVTYAVAVAYWLAAMRGVALVESASGNPLVDAAVTAFSALPTWLALVAVDLFTGGQSVAMFRSTPIAQAYLLGFGLAGALLAIGVAATFILQRWRVRAFVNEIARSRDEEYIFLVLNARRAPGVVKRALLGVLIYEREPARQLRLLEAARDMAIHEFPREFCRRLEAYSPTIQQAGLDRANELFRERAAEFDGRLAAAVVRKTGRALARGRLEAEPLKRLLRLMLTVVTTKKSVMKLSDRRRDKICTAIKAELERPRAEGDAALRGYLRELHSALGSPSSAAARKKAAAAKVPPVKKQPVTPVRLPEAPPIYATAPWDQIADPLPDASAGAAIVRDIERTLPR